MEKFVVPTGMREEIEICIRQSLANKSPGRDGVHNEMLKFEPELMSTLLYEVCKLVGRTWIYPAQWRQGLLTPVYKKGEQDKPQNYRPLCMLSCTRKVIEKSIAGHLSRKLELFGMQFGFQKGLSPMVTLLYVEAVVRSGKDRIAT